MDLRCAALLASFAFATFGVAPVNGQEVIFADGFESEGTCLWESSPPCTLHVITIPLGTANGEHPWPETLHIDLGAELRFVNGDTDLHRIHSDGGVGFPHQDSDMAQGGVYSVTPGEIGTYFFECHTHPGGGTNLYVE